MATRRFRAVLAQESVETQEGWLIREFPAGCFTWRSLPLTLMAQTTTPGMGGHAEAFIFARLDTIDREGDFIVAQGTADDGGEGDYAQRRRDTAHLIDTQMLNGISVDPGGVEITESCEEWNADEPDWCDVVRLRFDSYEIGAATLTTVPALGGTLIEWLDADWVDENAADDGATETADEPDEAAVAAAASITVPSTPPIGHFDDPQLTELTRVPVITEDGRVYGHLASWQDCHISFPTHCQPPWHSASSYAYAHVCDFPGGVLDGDQLAGLAVMPIAVRGGHYPTQGDQARQWREAQAHYDDTENVAAYVRVYEDEIGIAYSGAIRPGLDPSLLATFAAHRISTDHRRIGGNMELVGACSVNVPGFVRSVSMAVSASGALDTPMAAVIGGTLRSGERSCCDSCSHGEPCSDAVAASGQLDDSQRLARLERGVERLLSTLEPQLREQAVARLRAGVST